uniref:U3 small nucleolar RNA-associated protein 15 homolog n=1 Tax=Parastrongyloides trichosuri TaxID=131310 RepID=A0A0N4ZMK2_PARTI
MNRASYVKGLVPVTENLNNIQHSDDYLYWQRMEQVAVFQEGGNISSTTFLPVSPYYVATTSAFRLTIYDTDVCDSVSVNSRFKTQVFGATYRHDGSLLGCGSLDGIVRLYDVHKSDNTLRTALRTIKTDGTPCHVVSFSSTGLRVGAMNDSGAFNIYDVADTSGRSVYYKKGHEDHIRCGAFSSDNEQLLVTGSYDHTVKLWDTRNDNDKPALSVDHGCPVEKVILFPNNNIMATAGGQVIKLWDMTQTHKTLHVFENHHKTVTSLCLATNSRRLLSAGLDRRINVFNVDSGDFDLIYQMSTLAPVLTLAISPNDDCLVYGMQNIVAINRRKPASKKDVQISSIKISQKEAKKKGTRNVTTTNEEGKIVKVPMTAPILDKISLGPIERLINAKKFNKAIEVMFYRSTEWITNPSIIVAAFRQIYFQKALRRCLTGRDERIMQNIFHFIRLNLFNNAYFSTLMKVTECLIDIYNDETEFTGETKKNFNDLRKVVEYELKRDGEMLRIRGMLEVIFNANKIHTKNENINENIFGELIISPKSLSTLS